MAELVPAPFGMLVRRAFAEFERQRRIFDLPERKFYRARAGYDLGVRFHGLEASNAAGPAAGPQTQLVQNIVLSWLAGGRIFELKTVQINDRLEIPRPCIDATNVGFNVEWSQELRLEQSIREYVGASMLIEMLRASGVLDGSSEDESFAHSESIFDLSVGYDLKGIRNPRVVQFMRSCLDASAIIEELRPQVPERYAALRDLPFKSDLMRTATLSTFHGCPADEIEGICEFLLREIGLHTTIKLNPTLLGAERCEHLLRDELGYEEIVPAREHFDHDLKFDEMVPMVQRLHETARECGLGLGVKLTNTLVVRNHKDFFSDDVMYLSGAPLHVLTTQILADVREALGPELPISFSAGIDAHNFARAMSCNLTPITTCTDLLRPGGYGRLPLYLTNLESEMQRLGVRNVGDFILLAEEQGLSAAQRAVGELREGLRRSAASAAADPTRRETLMADIASFAATLERRIGEAVRGSPFQDVRAAIGAVWKTRPASLRALLRSGAETDDTATLYARIVELAGALNVDTVVERTRHDPRYAAARNARVPRKIGSHLVLYDCINCDKCIPVCPNDANFVYEVAPVDIEYVNYVWRDDAFVEEPGGRVVVEKEHQIANYADFCNDCGNCDVFCPEDGGPYVEKPRFFSSLDTWGHDHGVGFYVRPGRKNSIWGRFGDESEYMLQLDPETGYAVYRCDHIELEIEPREHRPVEARFPKGPAAETRIDMRPYHILRILLTGVLDARNINYVNAARV